MYEIRHYLTPSGKNLFGEWLDSLRDAKAEARIAAVWRRQSQAVGRHQPRGWLLERLSAEDENAMKDKTSVSHNEVMVKKLRTSRAFAAEYLRAAMEDSEEPQVLLIALRQVAEARGGMAKVAKAAGIERESLYRALSPRGNPRLSTLFAVTRAMGLALTVETPQPTHH
jgi:probable addiction module antidote protein